MNFKLRKLDSRFWNYVSSEDAKALLGYCYGRYHFLSYHDTQINIVPQYKILIYKDLMYALVLNNLIDTHKSDVKAIIEKIISILFESLEDGSLEDDLAIINITELSVLITKMKFDGLKEKLLKLINQYINHLSAKNDEESNIELKFHHNLHSKNEKYVINTLKIDDPLLEVLAKKDGEGITEIVVDILEDILEKVTNAKHKESPLFLDRTVLFREIGSGFIWSGYIDVAKMIGCKINSDLPKYYM